MVSSISDGGVLWQNPVPALLTIAYSLDDVPSFWERVAAADLTETSSETFYSKRDGNKIYLKTFRFEMCCVLDFSSNELH